MQEPAREQSGNRMHVALKNLTWKGTNLLRWIIKRDYRREDIARRIEVYKQAFFLVIT